MPSRSNYNPLWWGVDAVLLALLAAYVLAGVPLTPFHGDEGMQIYASRDYITAFVDRNPADLVTNPPYTIDSRPHLRLINGSVQRYVSGWVFDMRGYDINDLPIAPGWNWGLNYEENARGGWLPRPDVLNTARYTSAAFFALSIVVMYGLARQFGGRLAAYPATVLYALNPVLLLAGRRAQMEGSMLLFGLLTLFIAARIASRTARDQDSDLWQWVGLALAAGLTLASKHSGGAFVGVAWLWVFMAGVITAVTERRTTVAASVTGLLTLAGAGAIALFIALSPALWNDPAARLQNLLEERTKLVNIQVDIDENAPTTLTERAQFILTQPLIAPAAYYEWESQRVPAAIDPYQNSWLRGLPLGWIGGTVGMLLAGVGAVYLIREHTYYPVGRVQTVGVLLWVIAVSGALMANPLPWQRYVLPLVPAVLVLLGVGISAAVNRFRQ